jgi:hypothetical protein
MTLVTTFSKRELAKDLAEMVDVAIVVGHLHITKDRSPRRHCGGSPPKQPGVGESDVARGGGSVPRDTARFNLGSPLGLIQFRKWNESERRHLSACMSREAVKPFLIETDDEGRVRLTVRRTRYNSWNYPIVTSSVVEETFATTAQARAHAKEHFGAEAGQFTTK